MFLLGRPQGTTYSPGSTDYAAPRRGWVAPEDRPSYAAGPAAPDLDSLSPIVRAREEASRIRVQEEQLRRREEELARQEAELRRRELGDDTPE